MMRIEFEDKTIKLQHKKQEAVRQAEEAAYDIFQRLEDHPESDHEIFYIQNCISASDDEIDAQFKIIRDRVDQKRREAKSVKRSKDIWDEMMSMRNDLNGPPYYNVA